MRLSLPDKAKYTWHAWTHRLPKSLALALDLIPADPEDAALLRGAQLNAILRVSPVVLAASCLNAAVVLATFARMGALQSAHWVWALLVFAMAANFMRAWRARRRRAKRTASRRTIRRLVLNAAAFGALWGAIPALAFPGSPLQIQLLIACLTAGMMGGGAIIFAAVPRAGMSYVAMISAGTLFALLQEHSPVYLGILALLTSYVAVLVAALNWSAALLVTSLLAEAQVRREVAAREQAQAQSAHAERMTALGQLAGGIAHDFNNILQVVSGGAARIEKHPEDSESIVRQTHRIQEAVERGSAISRRLLAFARRDALISEPIDAAALLADLGELLAHTIGPSVRIHVDVARAQGRFIADRRQLETVILNLATNARDAMPSGGDLTISAASVVLDHGSETPRLKSGRYVRIAVADTGTGMDDAVLARAAEPFFTTKPTGMGTGLGLSMAKGFAEQSGGAFAINSEPADGTIVTLWLPQADAGDAPRADSPTREIATAASVGAGNRILIVDDDEPVRHVLVSALEDAGFVTLGAENAASALTLLAAGAVIDAVVTDFAMPGKNGIELIHELHARSPGLPAVLLTGHVGDVAAAQAVRKQRTEHFTLLQKPIRPARVAETLAALIAKRAT
jgi:signal transduction histidine kinase/ActR/RegA family two-component response regulator